MCSATIILNSWCSRNALSQIYSFIWFTIKCPFNIPLLLTKIGDRYLPKERCIWSTIPGLWFQQIFQWLRQNVRQNHQNIQGLFSGLMRTRLTLFQGVKAAFAHSIKITKIPSSENNTKSYILQKINPFLFEELSLIYTNKKYGRWWNYTNSNFSIN